MGKDEFEQRTFSAKKILEKYIGYRAPNALIGGWMVDSLEQIGFRYDSSVSVNSLYNKTDSDLEATLLCPIILLKTDLK